MGRDQKAYFAHSKVGGFQMQNPNNGISADFTTNGVTFQSGANNWGVTLRGLGYGDRSEPALSATPQAEANRIEYSRAGLIEWYENGPMGLEQGFTIAQAPVKPVDKPLNLDLALTGNVVAEVDPNGRGLVLRKNGTAVLRYGGLIASDAAGHRLKASMQVSGNRLRIFVEDAGAKYPVTIDPMVQSIKLTNDLSGCQVGQCAQGQAND